MALSKRLRRALLAEYVRAGRPEPEAFVLAAVRADNFRKREWRRILERVKLVDITMKDLRDTYASHLLTAGVQLGYVSRQLGHSDVAVTARHYAKWCGGDEYRDPVRLGAGELPADVLAKVAESHQSPTTSGAEALDSVHAAGESLAVGVA